ncbi:hypothetical protein J53TS2_20220 [Paenibacillus sp. J53TS2]|nr:hypothetical protein J53TS2_20220 [Paenibacillus sp. J53TS2]
MVVVFAGVVVFVGVFAGVVVVLLGVFVVVLLGVVDLLGVVVLLGVDSLAGVSDSDAADTTSMPVSLFPDIPTVSDKDDNTNVALTVRLISFFKCDPLPCEIHQAM